jgi:phage terminase small subunit
MAKLKQQVLLDEGDLLNPQQRKFADEYLANEGNAYRAYIAVYGPKKSRAAADVAAAKLLRSAKIQAYLSKKRDELSNKTLITAERVLRELAKIAFLNPKSFFNSDGSPKQINEMDDDTAAAVAGLEVCELFEGSGEQKHAYGLVKKIKIADKRAALVDLGKYLKLFTDRQEVSGPDGGPIEVAVTVDL